MGAIDALLNWLAPFLDPMQEFPTHANDMNGIHQSSLQSFRELIYKLDPNQALQQNTLISGDFANAINKSGQDFVHTEEDLSMLANDLNKLAEVADDFAEAVSRIMSAIEIASAKLEGDAVLTEVTTDVDIAAVAEGGFNPIADVLGIILTIIDGALIIDTLKDLAADIHQDIQNLKRDLSDLENAIEPPVAPEPKYKPVNQSWRTKAVDPVELKTLEGLYQNMAGGTLTTQQIDDILKGLLQKGLSVSDIEGIMKQLQSTKVSNADIFTFLNGILSSDGAYPDSPTPQKIVSWIKSRANGNPSLRSIVIQYAAIAGIPGASRLLERIISSTTNGSGYYYELKWAFAHKDQIARIEDIAPKSNGQNGQAADVVMKSGPFTKGAIVDTKSLGWIKLIRDPETNKVIGTRPMTDAEIDETVDGFVDQAKRDQSLYPGYPVVYCFNSKKPFPAYAQQELTKKLSQAGVTVMTSPPDKVIAVGQPQTPPSSNDSSTTQTATPGQLEQGIDILRRILSGGGSSPQLPPGPSIPQLPPGD